MKFIRVFLAIHGFLALAALAHPAARQEFRMGEPELLKPQEKILKLDDVNESRGLSTDSTGDASSNATPAATTTQAPAPPKDKCPEDVEQHIAYVGSSEIVGGTHYYHESSVVRCASHYKPDSGDVTETRTCSLGTDGNAAWEGNDLNCQAKDPSEITTCSELLESACEDDKECIWVDNDKKCIFRNANSCSIIPGNHIVYHNCTEENGVVYYVDESTATCAVGYMSSGSKNTLTCQHSPATGSFSWDEQGLDCKPIGGDKCKVRRSSPTACESDDDCTWDSTAATDKCSYKSKLSKLTHKAALDFCYNENDETDCKAKHCDWELNEDTPPTFHCTSNADKKIASMMKTFKSFAGRCSNITDETQCTDDNCEWIAAQDDTAAKCQHLSCAERPFEQCKWDCHWKTDKVCTPAYTGEKECCENRTDEAKHIFHAAAQGVKHEAGCVKYSGKKARCEVENNCHYWIGICYYKEDRN